MRERLNTEPLKAKLRQLWPTRGTPEGYAQILVAVYVLRKHKHRASR